MQGIGEMSRTRMMRYQRGAGWVDKNGHTIHGRGGVRLTKRIQLMPVTMSGTIKGLVAGIRANGSCDVIRLN